jgi:hypothetical protein
MHWNFLSGIILWPSLPKEDTIPPYPCHPSPLQYTTYHVFIENYYVQVRNIRTWISPCEATHAIIVNAVDHVSSKKDKLQLNFIKHSPSPNFKIEMTYV